ncbi:2'-5' RNA ligase family protein [Corynebacterium sp. H128]|uniref:2'-5' RNA ligase family protein n=1 Tax=unclassified Corynebacterium TaxID=2624378 RepID=UPI0030AE8AE4
MPSPENILLHLPQEQETQVRELFAQLAAQGFPQQHQTPHITITFAPDMPAPVVQRAAELLPGVIPAPFRRVGTVVFGTKRKQTVAWLLETTDELEQVARELSALNPAGRGNRWIPHLTVGLRLPREIIPDYLRALDALGGPKELSAQRAGYWQPHSQRYRQLAG